MSIAGIRRLVSKIVTPVPPVTADAGVRATSTPVQPLTAPEHAGPQVGNDRLPLATEMAAPSFMILSTRPRPRRHER
ncbi:hypothetical protein AB0D66_01545 [Streptomyces sp. NPDC048270]|uniref:hypothetical protein n=1 Tax=Streptomyces sp. NPDC048270 TaxID=3154615 RepID=UPI0033D7F335